MAAELASCAGFVFLYGTSPQSIARQEIIALAAEDGYYLAKSEIDVYQSGKLVPEPEGIDWSTVDADKYLFQQQPGTKKALGKIKFLFVNKSSVYLHDTPERAVFKKQYRAVMQAPIDTTMLGRF